MPLKEFGVVLHEGRKAAGLTQEELAGRAGCSKSYVSMLERGAAVNASGEFVRPDEKLIDGFSDILDIPRSRLRTLAGYAITGQIHSERQSFANRLARRIEKHFKNVPEERLPAMEDAVEQLIKVLVSASA